MKSKFHLLISLLCLTILLSATVKAFGEENDIPKLQNPISVQYLKTNLLKTQPRLVLNAELERLVKSKLKSDQVIQNMYNAIQANAEKIQGKPLLERKLEGRRLLGVSREMLYRINMLGMVYRIEKDAKILDRINKEVIAVCNFKDWNPSHYLDVAEMSMAVAIALDWTAGKLPKSTIEMAKTALIEKGIKPSWPENGKNPGWAFGHNNWNQVCNGGMIAASIAIAEKDPELASKTISRALDGMVNALVQYQPDGVYPEGSTYWAYGTSFTIMTAAMLESAFGTDFGIANYPGLKESAVYRVLMNTPSGWYYNFADCGDKRSEGGDVALAWFASKTGNKSFFEKDRFLKPTEELGELSRISGAALVWMSQYIEKDGVKVPQNWKGDGSNPIVIFTGGESNPGYYFGGKGGRATTSHGNMDAGSFIFELNGVRWSIDPGNQGYNTLEQAGFDLWNSTQNGQRWTLLTKNNYGHSTVTVNDSLFINNGQATLLNFQDGTTPSATFDLTAVYGDKLKSAKRTFLKDSPLSVIIEDNIETNEKTQSITWQMLTQADVEMVKGGAILKQDGKTLKLENISHPQLQLSVVSLYPAPLKLDRQMEGLKRIEIRIPAWTIENGKTNIKVRLSGE
ncbi:MAG: heparinase II/III family protein [Prolixibacteraceae bacterium]|nr:heparinase II/III family protein [Prolixibacteraceae bacterium]